MTAISSTLCRSSVLALVISAGAHPGAGQELNAAIGVHGALPSRLRVPVNPREPGHLDAQLVRSTIVELDRRSATFRDLLAVLAATSHVVTIVSPSTAIRYERGLMGSTRFAVSERTIVARVQIHVDRERPDRLTLTVAHEIAHVVEVACFGRVESVSALRVRMRENRGSRVVGSGMFETAFAERAAAVVTQEFRRRRATDSQWSKLVREFRLTSCPSTRDEAELLAAGRIAPDIEARDSSEASAISLGQ